VWKEGKGPDVAFEITSKSTGKEDTDFKMQLYQDVLKVKEYFLFDPYAEYLDPPLQGHRLRRGRYQEIQPVKGRLPSELLGLHLERAGRQLRLCDPMTDAWLPTAGEYVAHLEELIRLEAARREQMAAKDEQIAAYRGQIAALQGQVGVQQERADSEAQSRKRLESQMEQLRREFEDLRRRVGERNGENGK
jgi:hypothetical protein